MSQIQLIVPAATDYAMELIRKAADLGIGAWYDRRRDETLKPFIGTKRYSWATDSHI